MLTDQSIQIDYGKLDKRDRSAFDKRLTKKISIFNKHLESSTQDKLKIRIQQPKQSQYFVDITLFNSHTIHSNGKGDEVGKALENAFTPLKENLLQQINKNKEVHEKTPRQIRSFILNQAYGDLQKYVGKGDRNSFTKSLIPLLKDLKFYISRRLRYAHLIGMDKDRDITSGEMLNETVKTAYEKLNTKPIDFSLEHWLFGLSDEVLSSALDEAMFEKQHLKDWDDYVDRAVADMDVEITTSAEGNPELVENLDDRELITSTISDQFGYEIDYDKNLSDKERLLTIMKILAKMPSLKRSIFELHTIDGFSLDEIAKIKNIKKYDAEKMVEEVRTELGKYKP